MLTATVGKSLITKGYCKRLRTHSRRSERPKIMDVWRCKVLLRYGIRNNVGLYRCRLCGGDVFLSVSRGGPWGRHGWHGLLNRPRTTKEMGAPGLFGKSATC